MYVFINGIYDESAVSFIFIIRRTYHTIHRISITVNVPQWNAFFFPRLSFDKTIDDFSSSPMKSANVNSEKGSEIQHLIFICIFSSMNFDVVGFVENFNTAVRNKFMALDV